MKIDDYTFPFDLTKLPGINLNDNIMPFVEKVKNALEYDLQDGSAFGCKINHCHTHAGSKIHFQSFIEAELLFHNSYFNEGFASMTAEYINSVLVEDKGEYKNILLIGYEKYSELFLATLKDKINSLLSDKIKECEYCFYETYVEEDNGNRKDVTTISRIEEKPTDKAVLKCNDLEFNKENIENTLFLFIVPINTSLSTMDKMVAKFIENMVNNNSILKNSRFLCLITLYSNLKEKNPNEEFFEIVDGDSLKAKENKFEFIAGKPIKNFIICKSGSSIANKCNCCFPQELTTETPMFGVNRGSVVPMLQFGHIDYLNPIDKNAWENGIKDNCRRVWRLSEFMRYQHVSRGNNHYQFYFETEKFLEGNDKDLIQWLSSLSDNYKKSESTNQTFDYLVAPRHSTNAQFVYLVNKFAFKGIARIIFFDVNKEYRSNLMAKYSDLIFTINNITSSKMAYEIRFHFVDDTINSGTAFLNAKNLISSIIAETQAKDLDNIHLFYDGILLVNRLSEKRRNFYILQKELKTITRNKNYKNFHYFVNVNISPMRNYEDACTLCKLGYDYKNIRSNCATNSLAHICTDIISCHEVQPFSGEEEIKKASKEKRYLFFITHLLNERLANKFDLSTPNGYTPMPIEKEKSPEQIKGLLKEYYNSSFKEIFKRYIEDKNTEEFETCNDEFIWKVAFIKAISRPFFIYHIRRCQAAFSFCLDELNAILFPKKNDTDKIDDTDIKNSILIKTLVKALADMNANYIIRKKVLVELIRWTDKYEEIKDYLYNKPKLNDNEKQYIEKGLFSPDSLLHYIKKDLVLSRDTTKSLLLEHILLENKETRVLSESRQQKYDNKAIEESVKKFTDKKNKITLKGKLYLENNLILRRTLQEDIDKLITNIKNVGNLYFFENFANVWELNTRNEVALNNGEEITKKNEKIFNAYKEIRNKINNDIDKNKIEQDFSNNINKLFKELMGDNAPQVLAFLHDGNEKNNLFKYFTLAGKPSESGEELKNCKFKGLKTSQAFFHDKNISAINSAIAPKTDKDIENCKDLIFINDVLNENYVESDNEKDKKNPKSLIVRFQSNDSLESKKHVDNKGNEITACSQSNNDVEENKRANNFGSSDGKPDNSIYFQIWGFDKSKPLHWFALKLLLTLRNNFVKLIESVNLQELIEERKVEMQRAALAINKATTHSQSQNFFNNFISSEIDSRDKLCEKKDPYNKGPKLEEVLSALEDIKNNFTKKDLRKFKREIKNSFGSLKSKFSERAVYSATSIIPKYKFIIFDRYIQLLANEIVSSLYRKVIRGESAEHWGSIRLLPVLFDLFEFKKLKKSDNSNEGTSNIYEVICHIKANEKLKDVKLKFDFSKNKKGKVPCLGFIQGGIDAWTFIILIMATNYAEHELANEAMNVTVNKSSILFSNEIEGNDNSYLKYINIPPWLFEENNQHITLWSFKHLFNDEDKMICNIFPKENKFNVEFRFKE